MYMGVINLSKLCFRLVKPVFICILSTFADCCVSSFHFNYMVSSTHFEKTMGVHY